MIDIENSQARQRKVAKIVEDFLRAVVLFRRLYDRFKEGRLKFSEIERLIDDRGRSLLFNLKESSHVLALPSGESGGLRKEQLFDLALGSLFHGAMKLREDLYQKEVYGPRVDRLEEMEGDSDSERDLVRRFRRITDRAEERAQVEMEETRMLFDETIAQLRDLILDNAENGLLVRLLLSNESLVDEAFGEGALRELFESMYPKGFAGAQIEAGKSYLHSAHFDKANECFSRAAEARPSDSDLIFFQKYATGMGLFYEREYSEALAQFAAAIEAAAGSDTAPFLLGLGRLLRRLTDELSGMLGSSEVQLAEVLLSRLTPASR